jgi:hypothetical protein
MNNMFSTVSPGDLYKNVLDNVLSFKNIVGCVGSSLVASSLLPERCSQTWPFGACMSLFDSFFFLILI